MASKRPAPWSETEDRIIVADYLDMLGKELVGIKINKAATRRALIPRLNNRSEGSIEMKRMNISGVLRDLGKPHIAGYKPASNYQRSLVVAVKNALGIS